MPMTGRYLTSGKNIKAIFEKIQHGVPPDKFNNDHLKAIGFTSSNDRAVVPLLKDLGFLTGDGTPTQRYRDFRDQARSRSIMAEALREAYPDLFVINENLTKNDKEAILGRFKSVHDSSDSVADAQARTFLSILELADLKAQPTVKVTPDPAQVAAVPSPLNTDSASTLNNLPLTYRFEIQLPPTKDVEVFRAIFRAMREELIG